MFLNCAEITGTDAGSLRPMAGYKIAKVKNRYPVSFFPPVRNPVSPFWGEEKPVFTK
jgi:hypothetical protein